MITANLCVYANPYEFNDWCNVFLNKLYCILSTCVKIFINCLGNLLKKIKQSINFARVTPRIELNNNDIWIDV